MSASRKSGFMLLEVLVALVIAGLALIVLFRASGEGLFAVNTASRAEEAVARAQSHLAAVGQDVSLLQGESEGDDGGGFHWRLRISPVSRWQAPVAGGSPRLTTTLYDVEVVVSWPGQGHNRRVVLKTERMSIAGAGQ
jgi:general secretion pathway protein I